MLGTLSVPGRPTNLDKSRARANCASLAVSAGGGCLDNFSLIYLFSFLSSSLGDGPTEILCFKGPFNPDQPTNHLLRISRSSVRHIPDLS